MGRSATRREGQRERDECECVRGTAVIVFVFCFEIVERCCLIDLGSTCGDHFQWTERRQGGRFRRDGGGGRWE